MHLDLETDDVETEVKRLERLGATRWDHQQERGFDFWVMRDPWSNEFCVPNENHGAHEHHDRGALFVPLKVSEMIKLIETDGWYLVATRGSHRQYKHPAKPGRVTVAGKPSKELPPGKRSILRQAGITRRTQ
jgi:predicted RNA binding protein YcfA (HicA-like mRNA interferase family)